MYMPDVRFHLARQGETLEAIYRHYFGDISLSDSWDTGYPYFLTCNLGVAIVSPIALQGGEVIILPTELGLDLETEPVKISDVSPS